jgi:hypothetical protein
MSERRTIETGCAEIVERNLPAIAELCRLFGVRPARPVRVGGCRPLRSRTQRSRFFGRV